MLTKSIVIISWYVQIIMLYNLYRDVCQLFLNKTWKIIFFFLRGGLHGKEVNSLSRYNDPKRKCMFFETDFSSVAQWYLWPHGLQPARLPVHRKLPELAQTHVHPVGDAIQPSYPLSSPSPLAFNLSQHQGLFQWVSSSRQVAKVLELQLQHQSFQWIVKTDFL